jgi:hypothetical protein
MFRFMPEDFRDVFPVGKHPTSAGLKVMLCARDFDQLAHMAMDTSRTPTGMATWLLRQALGVAPQSSDHGLYCAAVLCSAIGNEIDSLKGDARAAGDVRALEGMLELFGAVLDAGVERECREAAKGGER